MVGSDKIDAAIAKPPPKSSLMRLGKAGTTFDIDPKAIEVNILALNHADDHLLA
jgi:hypothetical protein